MIAQTIIVCALFFFITAIGDIWSDISGSITNWWNNTSNATINWIVVNVFQPLYNLATTIRTDLTNAQNWLYQQFLNAWNYCSKVASDAWNWVQSAILTAQNFANGVGQTIWGWVNQFYGWVNAVGAQIKNLCYVYYNVIINFFTNLYNRAVQVLTSWWNNLATLFTQLWNNLVTILTSLWNNLVFFVVTAWNQFVTLITQLWSNLVHILTTFWSDIVWLCTQAFSFLVNLVNDPLNTLKDIVFGILKKFALEFGQVVGYILTFLMNINVSSIFGE
jgi:phage-related protein